VPQPTQIFLSFVIVFALAGCRATPTPLPPTVSAPTATVPATLPTPTPEAQPTATIAGTTPDPAMATQLGAVTNLLLTLPPAWQQKVVPATALQSAFSAVGDAAQPLEAASTADSSALVAWLPNAENPLVAGLLLLAIPRNELSLAQWLTSTQSSLTTQGATVLTGTLQYDLRSDGTPVATITYHLPTNLPTSDPAKEPVAGYQVALFDPTNTPVGERLVILTFTTQPERFAELLPSFQAIVRELKPQPTQ
jgi:hypothetical protein